MQPETCPLCTASNPRRLGLSHTDSGTVYTLWHCASCGVEFWWPFKNPGARWYEHDERYADRNQDPIRDPNWNHKKIISFLAPQTGRVLDVGCGVGNFLAWAEKNGWKGTGLDFDRDAIEAGSAMFGLQDLSVADLNEYAKRYQDEQFDLVTFFDVLEHLDNHNEFINHVRSLLLPGGHIAMSMPYRGHAEWLMRGDWPPRHLTRWDRSSLKKFLEDRGFEVVYMTRRTEGLRHIILKLRFMFGQRFSIGLVRKIKATTVANAAAQKRNFAVRTAELLAKAKDAFLFGLPAIIIWLVMLPSERRYITLYAIARKRD